jgi:hypothetical protein
MNKIDLLLVMFLLIITFNYCEKDNTPILGIDYILAGDTTGCVFVDLEPDMVIDIPTQGGPSIDSISLYNNDIYDVIFKIPVKSPYSFAYVHMYLKEGVEVAFALLNPESTNSFDWESAFLGFNYSFCDSCASTITHGEEISSERFKWKADMIRYSPIANDTIHKMYFVPIKKETNYGVLFGWIKIHSGYSYLDTYENPLMDKVIIEEFAIQRSRYN